MGRFKRKSKKGKIHDVKQDIKEYVSVRKQPKKPNMKDSIWLSGQLLSLVREFFLILKKNKKYGDVPYVDCVAVHNEEAEELVVFAVNKNLEEDITLTMGLRQFADYEVVEHAVLHDENLYAVNTEENPGRIVPVSGEGSTICDGALNVVLPHKSWNMILLGKK